MITVNNWNQPQCPNCGEGLNESALEIENAAADQIDLIIDCPGCGKQFGHVVMLNMSNWEEV